MDDSSDSASSPSTASGARRLLDDDRLDFALAGAGSSTISLSGAAGILMTSDDDNTARSAISFSSAGCSTFAHSTLINFGASCMYSREWNREECSSELGSSLVPLNRTRTRLPIISAVKVGEA